MEGAKKRRKVHNYDDIDQVPAGELFLNRELNWLEFNYKVLLEAADDSNPLLERVKFFSIFYNNLDEFFMVRVAGLSRQRQLGINQLSVDGLSPTEQLVQIRRRVGKLLDEASTIWTRKLKPALFKNGLKFISYQNLKDKEKEQLNDYYQRAIYPILTPQALDKGHPFPQVSGGSLNFFIELAGPKNKIHHARLKIPTNIPRFICLPVEHGDLIRQTLRPKFSSSGVKILPLEILLNRHLDSLFPGYKLVSSLLFRVTRNTDLELEEDEADDLLEAVRDTVYQRQFGEVIRLETVAGSPPHLVEQLLKRYGLEHYQHYVVKGPIAGATLMSLSGLDLPKLRFKPFASRWPSPLKQGKNIFKILKKHDVFLYHPYDSFSPVLDFVQQAAADPKVKAIKQTLYRTGNDSTLIDALIEARRADKQVTAVVELKARFDEMRNISWALALEEAGINVVYGLVGMKIHAKLCLVVRQEDEGLKSYVHIGTGNYNPVTAKIYTDFGLLTRNQNLGREIVTLFNVMTGLALVDDYKLLLVSPVNTRSKIIERIEREIDRHNQHKDGFIAFKMNQLSDPPIIKALYRASQAGVKVMLQIRGICCLRPGLIGLSENIDVSSIVGRFLEHSRVLYFHNGGQSEMFIGSADLMPRNLDRRIEVLAPILDEKLKEIILNDILLLHMSDNVKAHRLLSDGSYEKISSKAPLVDSQHIMLARQAGWNP